MTGAELVSAVRDQGGFASPRSDVLGWVNAAYRTLVAQSRWRQAERELGPTVSGQASYALAADIVDLETILYTPVDGSGSAPYKRKSLADIWGVKTGERQIIGRGGVFAPDFDSVAGKFIQLFPVPVASGDSLVALVALEPVPLTDDASAHIIPDDLEGALIDGAISQGMRRIEEMIGEADSYESRLMAGVDGLKRRKNSRVGSGPSRMQVAGYDF